MPGSHPTDWPSGRPFRAVVFDLDGTLYRQPPMRLRMAAELALAPLSGGARALRTVRALRAFRAAREELRGRGRGSEPLEELQYSLPASRLAVEPAEIRSAVAEWMHERPLRHLPACARPGLGASLGRLAASGVPLGVFSDYPVDRKLAALGVLDRFRARVDATEAEVNAFKPHPRGFEVAAARLGVPVADVLYVGDRADVDVAGAASAGMRSALIAARPARAHAPERAACALVHHDFEALVDAIIRQCV